MTRGGFGIVFALSVAGCGAPVINQASLEVVSDGGTIVFDKEFRYDISRENDLPRPRPGQFRGLLKGSYTARYEDAEGVYYANDNACVIYSAEPEQKLKFLSTGGIWISKSTAEPAFRLYWISGKPGPIRTPIDAEPLCGDAPLPTATSGGAGAAPKPKSVPTGVGPALANGVIEAIAEYERGKIVLLPSPVAGTPIAGAFRVQQR